MPTQVAYLGPKGTYAERAAIALTKLENLDEPVLLPCSGLLSVIENLAEKNCEAAVVPLENSVEGGVTSALDALWVHPNIFITRAVVIPIRHALLSSGDINGISEVLSHPQALAQCSGWLNKNLPKAIQLPTSSTAEAVRMVKGSKFRAAIGSQESLLQEGIKELAYPINDIAGNCTRFVLLTNKENTEIGDIASFAFSLQSNTPGALLNALKVIANLGLNMSRIESRPAKRELGSYVFFVDIELKDKDYKVTNELNKLLEPFCEKIIHFGSYPNTELLD